MHSSLRRFWLPVVGFWLAVGLLLVLRYWLQAGTMPLLNDNDDAMRMATAADLLHGQPWQDLIQHRDNAPFGGSMHWSRLVDAPIAGLMALFGPDWAAILWPLALLLPLLALSVLVTRALVRDADTVTALVLPVLTLVLNIEFLPGRVDHHNVQIVLTEALLLVLIVARRQVWGAVAAGVLAASSIAIGLETLPIAVATIAIYALLWVAEPAGYRRALVAFGLSFALAVNGHFLLATPPSQYFVAACDMVSSVYVVAAIAGGAALAIAALAASGWKALPRFGLLALLGAAAVVVTALLYPQCLAGPYAGVDPDILNGMFKQIPEAQPLWERAATQPLLSWAFAGSALIAVPLTAIIAWRETGERRVDWLIVLTLLVTAALVMVAQIRGARLAAALALPAAAWLITAARRAYAERESAARVAGLVASWLLFATTIQYFALDALAHLIPPANAAGVRSIPAEACLIGSRFEALAALPTGRVASPIGLSSHILRYTKHSVLSAGFHRNGQSIRDVEAFFSADSAAARSIAAERGLTYVAVCPGASGLEGEVPWAENGATWSWLVPLSKPDDILQLYRIDPAR